MPRTAAATKSKTPAKTLVTIALADLPRLGAELAGGMFAGIARGEKGEPDNALVVLIDDAKALTWKAAMAWAEKLGGSLPTRDEARICYANLREAFETTWYWTSTQYAGYESYAWYQSFLTGYQFSTLKVTELRARAVRRLPIQ